MICAKKPPRPKNFFFCTVRIPGDKVNPFLENFALIRCSRRQAVLFHMSQRSAGSWRRLLRKILSQFSLLFIAVIPYMARQLAQVTDNVHSARFR